MRTMLAIVALLVMTASASACPPVVLQQSLGVQAYAAPVCQSVSVQAFATPVYQQAFVQPVAFTHAAPVAVQQQVLVQKVRVNARVRRTPIRNLISAPFGGRANVRVNVQANNFCY